MIDMDELKEKWAELDRKLDMSIRLNRRLLETTKLNQTRSALRRLAAYLGLEAGLWGAAVVALGSFIYRHISVFRLAIPAVALDLYSLGMLIALIREIAMATSIDYGKPVTAIQKQIEASRVLRIRTIQWGVLAGCAVWAPFLIVFFKAAFGVDMYEGAWVWSNVAFGLALVPLVIWTSRKFSTRMGRSPMIQKLMRSLAGYNLNAAMNFMAALSEFESESRVC